MRPVEPSSGAAREPTHGVGPNLSFPALVDVSRTGRGRHCQKTCMRGTGSRVTPEFRSFLDTAIRLRFGVLGDAVEGTGRATAGVLGVAFRDGHSSGEGWPLMPEETEKVAVSERAARSS